MPPAPPSLRPQPRSFSTSISRAANAARPAITIKEVLYKKTKKHGPAPAHPYPARTTYKQSNYGLYGGSHIRYGNKVSEKNENKSRRFWRPNIQTKAMWSEALGRMVRLRLQVRVLRTIDKVGGLDEYLLGNKAQRIKELGVAGWALRWSIINTPTVKERFRQERIRLGVPEMSLESRLELKDQLKLQDPV